MRILAVGGAGFAGSEFVRAAVARGHDLTVFGRRNANANLLDNVAVIHGDRFHDLHRIPSGKWDAVVDFAAFHPRAVEILAEELSEKVGHYTLVSTVMTYLPALGPIDERSPVFEIRDAQLKTGLRPTDWLEYGSWKVACERSAEANFPGKNVIVRPGVISGPGDSVDHLAFWFHRFQLGGKILVPGEASRPIQFIDARDLATWIAALVEGGATGLFNATGPAKPMTMGELIDGISRLFRSDYEVVWAPADWLSAKGVRGDDAPFFWCRPLCDSRPGELWLSYEVTSAKALGRGLHLRRPEHTLADNLSWFRSLPPERRSKPRTGWSAATERRLLGEFERDFPG